MANNDLNEFYRALGQALSEWQYIEWELFKMYNFFLGPVHWQVASASFYSHHTFRGKIRLLKTTGKMYFEQEIEHRTHKAKRELHLYIKSLNWVLSECLNLSEKRNDLAHHMIDYDGEDDAQKPVLAPPFTARRLKNVPAKTTEDIYSICNDFVNLADLIWEFNLSLYGNHPYEAPQKL